jgi:lipopolysaccharide export system permease protein
LVFVGQQLVASDLSYLSVAKLMPYLFLMGLQYSVPPTILFSVCCVYGRISADNEIIALKSGGISPMCIFRPAIVLGFLLSVPSVWINDMAVSWAKPTIERVILRSLEEIIYKGLSSKKAYNSEKGFAIHVQDVKDRWLIKPNIWMQSDNQLTTIIAERAKISIDPEKDKMIIELVDSLVVLLDGSGQKEIRTPGSEPFEMPLNLANKNGASSVRPAHYSIGQIPAELARQNGLNDRRREKLATRQAIALASGRYVSLNDDAARLIAAEMSNTDNRLARLKTEPMRRWSQGFSCLAFVWIGVPMAVLIRSARDNGLASKEKLNDTTSFIAVSKFIWADKAIVKALVIIAAVASFGLNFPITTALMAVNVFKLDAAGYGLLSSTIAIGALFGGLISANRNTRVPITKLASTALIFGLWQIGAGFSPNIIIYSSMLALSGLFALLTTIAINSLIQNHSPYAIRGKILGIYTVIFSGGMALGGPLIGFVADLLGPKNTLKLGGTLIVLISFLVIYSSLDSGLFKSREKR